MKTETFLKNLGFSIMFIFALNFAYGQTKKVCSKTGIPSGWVITGVENCMCCGAQPTYRRERYIIKKISDMKIGSKVSICIKTNVPDGWVVVSESECRCCGALPTYRRTKWSIERID